MLIIQFSSSAYSGVIVYFANQGENDICVKSYHGADPFLLVAYKYRLVRPGEKKSIKCKGQGKDRCKIQVSRRLDGGSMSGRCKPFKRCVGSECAEYITSPSGTKISNNTQCTYTSYISDINSVAGESIDCDSPDSRIEYTDRIIY